MRSTAAYLYAATLMIGMIVVGVFIGVWLYTLGAWYTDVLAMFMWLVTFLLTLDLCEGLWKTCRFPPFSTKFDGEK